MPTLPITGHCLCGAVSYSIASEPMTVAICHCDDCQRQSGAPFSLNVGVDRDDFSLTGTTKTVATNAQAGDERERVFCPECGSPIISILSEADDIVFVKAGTLDDRSWLQPEMEVFVDYAHPWFHDADAEERGLFARSLPT